MATRKCPDCSEEIESTAAFCKFCGYNFRTGGAAAAQAPRASSGSAINGTVIVGIIFIVVGALLFITNMNSNRSFPAGIIPMVVGFLNVVRGLNRG